MDTPATQGAIAARQAVMALCAEATCGELRDAVATLGEHTVEDLRPPEIGLVMARGRIGGDGRAFNLGEVSVTRAAIRLGDGRAGFAYHLGRDRAKARLAAIVDAHWQREPASVEAALAPAAGRLAADRDRQRRRAAATRVEFFTMVRGED